MSQSSSSIARSIEQHDHFRTRALIGSGRVNEWSHFCLRDGSLIVLVNFSLVEDAQKRRGRLTWLCRSDDVSVSEHWDGEVLEFDDADVRFERAGHEARLGSSQVTWTGNHYCLRLNTDLLRGELSVQPTASPYLANNLAFVPGANFNWFVTPRCLATGWIESRGTRHEIRDAPTYHDHNWGQFAWSGEFNWEWGYSLGRETDQLSVIVSRISDGMRHRSFTQGLLVWRGEKLVRAFRDDEVRLRRIGLMRPNRVFRVPRMMSLLVEGEATDIPERFEVEAAARGDEVLLSFQPQDVAQIVVSGDRGLGVTCINEVFGELSVRGVVEGISLDQVGHASFEFLSR